MPAENLPIQNINDSHVGFLFGSANSSLYVTEMPGTTTTAKANTRMFIFGKGNGISGAGINESIGAGNNANDSCWVNIFGANNIASGQFVLIHGGNNGVYNNIGGGASMAIGHSNHISGTNNYTIGCSNMITGYAADTYGYDNFAFGHSNNISGASNVVFGGGNDISGTSNFVYGCFVGPGDSVSGNYNIAFGKDRKSVV